MTIRKIPFVVGEYYHIYNRGVDKRTIFIDPYDYKRFMVLLYICNSRKSVNIRALLNKGLSFVEIFDIDREETLVDIGVYCLMPNHFHILIKEKLDGGISMFMEKLATAYVMYFNTKNERKGALFEGSFKAKHIDNDAYLNWVFSYIHINPIKLNEPNWKESGISNPTIVKDFVEKYAYSSYYDYFLGNRSENVILNKIVFSDYFSHLDDLSGLIQEFREGNY